MELTFENAPGGGARRSRRPCRTHFAANTPQGRGHDTARGRRGRGPWRMMPEVAANGQFRGPIDILVPFSMKAAVTDRSRELRRHELAVRDHEGRVASLEQARS